MTTVVINATTVHVQAGFSVAVKSANGLEVLAHDGKGVLPFVFGKRKEAVAYKREFKCKCRVVPVFYVQPLIKENRISSGVGEGGGISE